MNNAYARQQRVSETHVKDRSDTAIKHSPVCKLNQLCIHQQPQMSCWPILAQLLSVSSCYYTLPLLPSPFSSSRGLIAVADAACAWPYYTRTKTSLKSSADPCRFDDPPAGQNYLPGHPPIAHLLLHTMLLSNLQQPLQLVPLHPCRCILHLQGRLLSVHRRAVRLDHIDPCSAKPEKPAENSYAAFQRLRLLY